MENQIITNLAYLSVIIILIGFFLAYLYGRKTKEFKWSEYIAVVIPPTLVVVVYAYYVDLNIIRLYLYSAMTGFVLEHLLGLVYHKVLNKRLWTYNRLSWHGYTSLLSIPFWGSAGIAFWILSKLAGL